MQRDKSQSQSAAGAASAADDGRTPLAAEEFHGALATGARLIGIDVGTKTLGLALSDVTRTIASPLETIRRKKFAIDAARLLDLAAEHRIGGFVVGLPANLDASEIGRASCGERV